MQVDILNCRSETLENYNVVEKTILDLADNMAAAASSFSSHGYDAFIQARDNFKEVLHSLVSTEEPKVH